MDNEHLTPVTQVSQNNVVNTEKRRFCLLNSAWWPFVAFLFFSLIYIAVFKILKPEATDIVNPTIAKIFKNYSLWFGVVFAFLIMLSGYVLYGLKSLFKMGKFYFLNPLLLALAVTPWFNLAYALLYKEKRYTDIGKGLISYAGTSLWWTCIVMFGLATVWFLVSLIIFLKKK